MKKTLVATALLALIGAAQAFDSQGDSTDAGIIKTGGATVGGFHGPIGAPGIALDGSNYISLQSIDRFSYKDSATAPAGVAFRRYQLLGYSHPGPGGTISTDLNWFKVPALSQNVYFGLATNAGTPNQHAAFYVGDRTGYAVPTATTNYAAAGLLAVPSTTGSAPVILQGALQYNTATGQLNTVSGLTGGGYNLAINSTVNAAAGTFSGTSALSGIAVGSGSADGKFFGSGATSAVAGIAKSSSGSNYVASFGGVKN